MLHPNHKKIMQVQLLLKSHQLNKTNQYHRLFAYTTLKGKTKNSLGSVFPAASLRQQSVRIQVLPSVEVIQRWFWLYAIWQAIYFGIYLSKIKKGHLSLWYFYSCRIYSTMGVKEPCKSFQRGELIHKILLRSAWIYLPAFLTLSTYGIGL